MLPPEGYFCCSSESEEAFSELQQGQAFVQLFFSIQDLQHPVCRHLFSESALLNKVFIQFLLSVNR